MPLGSAITKTIASTFVVGSAAGCLDTGTVANSTWYHLFLIERTDHTIDDVLCSLSLTAPTMPTGYTFFRRIGSLLTDGSAHWVSFKQWGDEFRWSTPIADISSSSLSTTATNFPLSVPPGITVNAHIRGFVSSGTVGTKLLVASPLLATPVAGTPAGEVTAVAQVASTANAFTADVLTDTSKNVVAVASAASTTITADTYGWTDRRGQDN
jgi:hypothetical protein